jgi:hypothetical protein
MGVLMFECPKNGTPVSTGLEMDAESFLALSKQPVHLQCPHCPAPHLLGDVRAWLSRGTENPSPERPPTHLTHA